MIFWAILLTAIPAMAQQDKGMIAGPATSISMQA